VERKLFQSELDASNKMCVRYCSSKHGHRVILEYI